MIPECSKNEGTREINRVGLVELRFGTSLGPRHQRKTIQEYVQTLNQLLSELDGPDTWMDHCPSTVGTVGHFHRNLHLTNRTKPLRD